MAKNALWSFSYTIRTPHSTPGSITRQVNKPDLKLNCILEGIVEFLFQTANVFEVVIAIILIYDISSALVGPKIAVKVILDPKMCEI